MNCNWQDVPDSTDHRGWRKTRCVRCGFTAAPWPVDEPGHRFDRLCPVPGWADWLAYGSQVLFGFDHIFVGRWLVNWQTYFALCLRYVAAIVKSYFTRQTFEGPGSALERMLKAIGGYQAGTCQVCAGRVRDMNIGGSAWCRENIKTIVGWLKESADRARLPYTEWAAVLLVRRAIAVGGGERFNLGLTKDLK